MDALQGVKVVELPGLAPVPFCGQILADFGADVTFVEKVGSAKMPIERKLMDKKKKVQFDFKKNLPKLRELVLNSDILLDPYRPGVLEAIGLDPVELMEKNKRLIVARISGYGQTGPYKNAAGHDINYVALSGVMPLISGPNRPYWPPANLLGDFAGGALSCAFGICAALIKRERTGEGSIIDVSMTEGVAYLGSYIYAYQDREQFWDPEYGFFSGRCPIFRTFETKDGKFVACGALEPKFHNEVFKVLKIDPSDGSQEELVKKLEVAFKSKTRDEWQQIFGKLDSCVSAVLDIDEVGDFPQHKARDAFHKSDGLWKPRPSPRIYSKEEFKNRSKL